MITQRSKTYSKQYILKTHSLCTCICLKDKLVNQTMYGVNHCSIIMLTYYYYVWLFVVWLKTREYLAHMNTQQLPVINTFVRDLWSLSVVKNLDSKDVEKKDSYYVYSRRPHKVSEQSLKHFINYRSRLNDIINYWGSVVNERNIIDIL